jgi:hypothetical protein
MSHKPPTFASSPDPLDADDWLKSIEKMLNIAQCSDREKVLYASGRLTGPAVDWWDSYTTAHDAADTITWAEFSTCTVQKLLDFSWIDEDQEKRVSVIEARQHVCQRV